MKHLFDLDLITTQGIVTNWCFFTMPLNKNNSEWNREIDHRKTTVENLTSWINWVVKSTKEERSINLITRIWLPWAHKVTRSSFFFSFNNLFGVHVITIGASLKLFRLMCLCAVDEKKYELKCVINWLLSETASKDNFQRPWQALQNWREKSSVGNFKT